MTDKGREREAQAAVDTWNDVFPVGALVRYWTGLREGSGALSRTRTAASVLGGHTAVVWVEGESSCIALTHVQVQEPVEPPRFEDTCCGQCGPGLCYVDQMTGA